MGASYATLAEIKATINTQKDTENIPLLDYAATISERIDLELGRDLPFFLPYRLTDENILITPGAVNSGANTLALDDYWLEIDSVTQNGQARTWDTDVFAYPPSASPIHGLRLASWCNGWYDAPCDGCTSTPLTTVLSGVLGYRRRGGSAWKQIGTLAADINASVTSITVNNLASTPVAISGESDSRFSAGCLFRIGDEYFSKVFSNSGTEVERGIHGTTAAAHTADDAVEVFQVERNIARVTARQAGLWLARRGAYDTRNSNELGTPISYPSDLLHELLGVLQEYANL